MEIIGASLLILGVALFVGVFITQPFLRRKEPDMPLAKTNAQKSAHEHVRSSLLAERDRVLTALQELDFDYSMGKVPQEEYPSQRAELLKSGALILKRLETLAEGSGAAGSADNQAGAGEDGDSIEDRIEAAVRARRADAARSAAAGTPEAGQTVQPGVASLEENAVGKITGQPERAVVGPNGGGKPKDELEEMIAARKRQRNENSGGFCPRCGRPVQKSDKFCAHCGAVL